MLTLSQLNVLIKSAGILYQSGSSRNFLIKKNIASMSLISTTHSLSLIKDSNGVHKQVVVELLRVSSVRLLIFNVYVDMRFALVVIKKLTTLSAVRKQRSGRRK